MQFNDNVVQIEDDVADEEPGDAVQDVATVAVVSTGHMALRVGRGELVSLDDEDDHGDDPGGGDPEQRRVWNVVWNSDPVVLVVVIV